VTDALSTYAELVRAWGSRIGLVSDRDLDRFRERHVDDSLRLLPLVDSLPAGPAVDVGSGAGLPGIPLAISRPGRAWRLLEPRRRRAAFLEEVVRELALVNCQVVAVTAQDAGRDPHLAHAHVLATARALTSPRYAPGLLLPLLAPGGTAAVFVGGGDELPPGTEEFVPGIGILRSTD